MWHIWSNTAPRMLFCYIYIDIVHILQFNSKRINTSRDFVYTVTTKSIWTCYAKSGERIYIQFFFITFFHKLHYTPYLKMPRGQELSVEVRGQIVGMMCSNKSTWQIRLELGLPHSTIAYAIQRFKKTGSSENISRPGCPSLLAKCDKNHLTRMVKQNHFKPLHEITNQEPTKVSISIARNVLKERGISQYTAAKKTLITPRNIQERKD